MPLSWNEIKHRAIRFGADWKDETREAAERQTFWNEFFNVFGLHRRAVASFEEPVRKLSGTWGAIDIFWPGKMLGEHKSAGADLSKAHAQGMEYVRGLLDSGRAGEAPRYLIVSDFRRIALHDLEGDGESHTFPVADLHKHVRHFAFIAGYRQRAIDPEDPANIEAAELMARLHDALLDGGYTGHDLRQFLVRVLFCLFADDTGIFPPDAFKLYLKDRTAPDGSDLGPKLDRLFRVLNTPESARQANLDEDLRQFPYVNGHLFEEKLEFADFNTAMRAALLAAAHFRWERISPAVFGSLFQGVMDARERRQIGAHYTSESNILKLVRSLFLDDLRAEFDAIREDRSARRKLRLTELQKRLAALRFLDPACGCGNFLVITYREIRRLELDILKELHRDNQKLVQGEMTLEDVNHLSLIDVDQMYGIEIEEFPARIAEVALWLADHQMNQELSLTFGQFVLRIPLRKSPHIHVANALRTDWRTVLPPQECSFVLGNPPFVGKSYQSDDQKADLEHVMGMVQGGGLLDFVTGWYELAARYIQNTRLQVAFVSTNSIAQGEQVSILWSHLLQKYGLKIHFAHRTFPWQSEARGKAHVHCVIIGFAAYDLPTKRLYDYETDPSVPTLALVKNISPYLIEGSDQVAISRTRPICDIPPMIYGSKPTDGGNLLLSDEEYRSVVKQSPDCAKFIRPFLGAEEFINGVKRWCFWLVDADPKELRGLPEVFTRIELVKQFRASSKKSATREDAATPSLFAENRQPNTDYLLVPSVSSERRKFIPIGFVSAKVVASNLVFVVPFANSWMFGVISSTIHMAWMRQVAGRLKSDYRYSNKLVYNNFPWPTSPTDAQRQAVEKSAQAVLDARAKFPDSTLADLYDPVTMPPVLVKAHADLDRAVERCYRKDPFPTDRSRVEFLFALYENLTAPLVTSAKVKRGRKAKTTPPTATSEHRF